MQSRCPFQSDLLETASNTSDEMHSKLHYIAEQSDQEFLSHLKSQQSELISPFSPEQSHETDTKMDRKLQFYPESQPTSESTSLNSQPFTGAVSFKPPFKTKTPNVYEYKLGGPVPTFNSQANLFSSFNSQASFPDEAPMLRPQNLNALFKACDPREKPTDSPSKSVKDIKKSAQKENCQEFAGLQAFIMSNLDSPGAQSVQSFSSFSNSSASSEGSNECVGNLLQHD